jgi:hypothetical protein
VAEVSQAVQHQLATAWRTVSTAEARLIEDERTEVTEWPAPFLSRFRIYRVEHFAAHPVLLYAGFAVGEGLFVLNGSPDSFVALARADGVRIRSAEMALAYVEAFFETTRDMSELTYVVRSADDVQWRAASAAEPHSPIEPPRAELADGEAVMQLYVMRQQVLERRHYLVAQDGAVSVQVDVLERDLPVVYGL